MPDMRMPDKSASGWNLLAVRWPVLGLVVAGYLTLGLLYATRTPAWQVPDEPAHYNVVRQIVETGRLPRLEPGDYDQAYLGRLTAERFPPELSVATVQYQDYQPPLYYLLAAPVYAATGGALTALRLFSLVLGAGVIVGVYLIGRALFPDRPALALTAAGLVAFIPQHVAMLAGVNNDSLAELVIAIGLWLAVRPARPPVWAFGLVLGLAFLTKVQAYVLAPVFMAHALLRWRHTGERPWGWLARVFGLGVALGALYWGRNWLVCGPMDVVCGRWHNQVVTGQPTTAEWIAQFGWASYLERLVTFTFDSFWGVFGWMGVFMDARVYLGLAVFSAALVVGGVGAARGWRALAAAQQHGLLLLALSAATTLALFIYYNTSFVQHQGRYLFPALAPLGLAAALSLAQWERWLARLTGRPMGGLASLGAVLALAALTGLALFRFVLPALS